MGDFAVLVALHSAHCELARSNNGSHSTTIMLTAGMLSLTEIARTIEVAIMPVQACFWNSTR